MSGPDNTNELINQPSYSPSAESESNEGISISAPNYSLSSNGDDGNEVSSNSSSLTESELEEDYNELISSGNMKFSTPELSIFHDGHPTFMSKRVGKYRYWCDEAQVSKPLLVGPDTEIDKYVVYDKDFGDKIWQFVRQREMDRDKQDASYIYYKGAEMKGTYKWVDGILGIDALGEWQETKAAVKGIEANLSTGEIEVNLPGPASLGTIQMNLDEPYWGIKPYLKPSFSLGVFGMEFDIPKSEVGVTFGIAAGPFGTEMKLVFGVNTDNTSRDFQQYVCYELMPWIGEIKDALG